MGGDGRWISWLAFGLMDGAELRCPNKQLFSALVLRVCIVERCCVAVLLGVRGTKTAGDSLTARPSTRTYMWTAQVTLPVYHYCCPDSSTYL
jgi:hypothetical protein